MKSLLTFLAWFTVIAGGIAAILLSTCLRVWQVPSDDPLLALSVMPTLEAGDNLLLWRVGAPVFGDLVRCPDPEAAGRFVIGRILGDPGDRIMASLGSVTVNDKLVSSLRACVPAQLTVHDPTSGEAVELACDTEKAGGVEYSRARAAVASNSPPPPFRVRVPDDHVFLASDDRHYHDDSRDFGTLPKSSCQERIVFRLWSTRGWFDSPKRLTFIN